MTFTIDKLEKFSLIYDPQYFKTFDAMTLFDLVKVNIKPPLVAIFHPKKIIFLSLFYYSCRHF